MVSCECPDVTGYLTAVSAAVNSLSDTLNTRPSWKPIQYALYVRLKEYFGTDKDRECDSKWEGVQKMFGAKSCGQVFVKGLLSQKELRVDTLCKEDVEGIKGLLGTFAMRTVLPFLKNYSNSFDV